MDQYLQNHKIWKQLSWNRELKQPYAYNGNWIYNLKDDIEKDFCNGRVKTSKNLILHKSKKKKIKKFKINFFLEI